VANYPAALRDERDCLNCGEPFPPAKEGWQSLYCSMPCWRANNGGPGRRPRLVAAEQALDGSAAAARISPAALEPAPEASRLAVVRTKHCPRCDAAHEVYGYPERTGG
jgi:hypothetical protein